VHKCDRHAGSVGVFEDFLELLAQFFDGLCGLGLFVLFVFVGSDANWNDQQEEDCGNDLFQGTIPRSI